MARRVNIGRRELFVDTSAWIPLLQERHPDHVRLQAPVVAAVRAGARLVTSNLVLAETYTFLRYRRHREVALEFLRAARKSPNLVVTSTEDLEERAQAAWLERFSDQDFSFADAVSFAVMQDRDIACAVTLDKHFIVAGFDVIPDLR